MLNSVSSIQIFYAIFSFMILSLFLCGTYLAHLSTLCTRQGIVIGHCLFSVVRVLNLASEHHTGLKYEIFTKLGHNA